MSNNSTSRYYTSAKDIWKQKTNLSFIVFAFVVTLVYASGLQDDTMQKIMFGASFIYPLVIAITFLSVVHRINYRQLDADGLSSVTLGFIRKRISWSAVKSLEKTTIGDMEGLGVKYKSSVPQTYFMKSRQKMFGWDDLIADAHLSNGASLIDDALKSFKKYSRK